MFDKYHYAKQDHEYIIYEAKNIDNGVQMSLYLNDKLIDSKTGLLGEFELEGENIKLKIKNSALKSSHVLSYNGSEIEMQTVKLKDLRKELSESNIYNVVNPTKAQIEAGKFNWNKLLIPILLMLIGFTIQYFVRDMSKSYQLIAVVPEAIAGWMLFDISSERVSWLKNMRKGRIGFMALVVVGLGLLGEFLFQYF